MTSPTPTPTTKPPSRAILTGTCSNASQMNERLPSNRSFNGPNNEIEKIKREGRCNGSYIAPLPKTGAGTVSAKEQALGTSPNLVSDSCGKSVESGMVGTAAVGEAKLHMVDSVVRPLLSLRDSSLVPFSAKPEMNLFAST